MDRKVFLDSNLFLYAYSNDPADQDKRMAVGELLQLPARIHLSTQVLQEFIACALRKKRLGLGERDIDHFLQIANSCSVVSLGLALILHATRLRRRFSLSHWDSTIIAAAHTSGCRTLYSEDLQHGFTLDQLTITDPFR